MAAPSSDYQARAVHEDGSVQDVELTLPDGRVWRLVGRGGPERELALLAELERRPEALPVFLGSGLGIALERALYQRQGPVAVVDKEAPIQEATGMREWVRQRLGDRVLWIDEPDPEQALAALTRWQMEHGGAPLAPVGSPVYLRLDRDYYGLLRDRLRASATYDFWAKARYPRFTSWPPRMLLVTSQYFLMGEIVTACRRLGVPHHYINIGDDEMGSVEFVQQLLEAVVSFKPDFVFTINHLGVDREGVLVDLLDKLGLPLASWFVDNPHLILYLYSKVVSDNTAIFTWDVDNLDSLRELGFSHVRYLPLATDAQRFRPGAPAPAGVSTDRRVGFVGNSMLYKVGHRMKKCRPPRELLLRYREIAAAFGRDEERSVRAFLAREFPELAPHFEALDTPERRLAFEAMITWEATRQYRTRCVDATLPFGPLIAGDRGWKTTFRSSPHPWAWRPELSYYDELPGFYPLFDVNFNCTSKQMKGAVNQRVFDAPATGSFVLTDWREQIENLFEPGREVVCYADPGEIPGLLERWLADEPGRLAVAQRARRRILAEHTYERRLTQLMETMRDIFA